jgi:hypothetical protein
LIKQKEKRYGPAQRTSTEAGECDPFAYKPEIVAMSETRYECAIWENDTVRMTLFSETIGDYPSLIYTALVERDLREKVQSADRADEKEQRRRVRDGADKLLKSE